MMSWHLDYMEVRQIRPHVDKTHDHILIVIKGEYPKSTVQLIPSRVYSDLITNFKYLLDETPKKLLPKRLFCSYGFLRLHPEITRICESKKYTTNGRIA